MSEFRTSDVDLAAYLVCKGYPLRTIHPPTERPWHADFAFDDRPEILISLREWGDSSCACHVDARRFALQRRDLYRLARDITAAIRGPQR